LHRLSDAQLATILGNWVNASSYAAAVAAVTGSSGTKLITDGINQDVFSDAFADKLRCSDREAGTSRCHGRYWRATLVLFFNYGLDTGTIWKSIPWHEPIRWRNVCWDRHAPDREVKEQCRWGWLFYRRVKTGKAFYRPMNRVVHAHVRSILPNGSTPDEPVFLGGGARPNVRFQQLCKLAGVKPKANADTGRDEPWELNDLRKTCATYYDEHMPESSIEILGHSVSGITYRHYAHRAPLAFKAIMTLPQPMAFTSLAKGFDGECPCCRRKFSGPDS